MQTGTQTVEEPCRTLHASGACGRHYPLDTHLAQLMALRMTSFAWAGLIWMSRATDKSALTWIWGGTRMPPRGRCKRSSVAVAMPHSSAKQRQCACTVFREDPHRGRPAESLAPTWSGRHSLCSSRWSAESLCSTEMQVHR